MKNLRDAAEALRRLAKELEELSIERLSMPDDITNILDAINAIREVNGGKAVSLDVRFQAYSAGNITVSFHLIDHGDGAAGEALALKSFTAGSLREVVAMALARYGPPTTAEDAERLLVSVDDTPIPF